MLSSLSHDLRTPLASIIGAASSLLDYEQALDPRARREMAQTIQDEAERLNRFIQNLLDMTRISAGALKPNVDWADLRDIVASAVERARRLARHHGIRVDIDPELPLLSADAVLLEQTFFNLLDNACKYAPPGSTVTVWARRMPSVVAIEVCDQGPGIAAQDREKVFDMFYRTQTGDSHGAGTGLGLAICRGIIEAHGGTIRIDAGLHGTGACVIVRLPLPTDLEPGMPPEEEP